ncbi:helix-turn-helix domain-containing protein [Rathayibacter sp. CAU 1779]
MTTTTTPATPDDGKPEPDQFATIEEVARYWRVHYNTVYRLIHAGKLPARKVGAAWRIDWADVKASS